MEKPKLQIGDIYLTDNWKLGAKLVQWLCTAPTMFHHLWWKITGRLDKERVKSFHAGMVLNENEIIEQQGTVKINPVSNIYRKEVYIYRKNELSGRDKLMLETIARADLGEKYGILECFGKLFGWLTGIKYFAKWFDMKNRAICVVRVGEWFLIVNEDFGVSNPNYITAKNLEKYLEFSPDWTLIYQQQSQ